MVQSLVIPSPKRNSKAQAGWEGFFPYYAGFPESFAKAVLISANLDPDVVVLDPWNGSGTSTSAASLLGLRSIGIDLNPVMVIVARARLLSPSEVDSIEPISLDVVKNAIEDPTPVDCTDSLTWWFDDRTAATLRSIERSIERRLLGSQTLTPEGPKPDRMSGIAATCYVALFSVCRMFAAAFRSSNPTWLRIPKNQADKLSVADEVIVGSFRANLRGMADALVARVGRIGREHGQADLRLADTTSAQLPKGTVDFILTSPPYCTRIDYTAATRVELAVVAPLVRTAPKELSRQMIGSTRVPIGDVAVQPEWGNRCAAFLDALRNHHSKASARYYYHTHVDYFDKISRSLRNLAGTLKTGGTAILIVQDSYYKDLHNDLPSIIADIGEAHGLALKRQEKFYLRRSMSGINPRTRIYNRKPGAVEAVLCFQKD